MCAITAKSGPSSADRRRALVLYGSPHGDGPTARLTEALTEALPAGWAARRLDCYALRPLPCTDCRYCHTHDGCSLRDLDEYYALLEDADAIVYASPVYNRSFPAPMKALLDRGQRYWAARLIRRAPHAHALRPAALLTAAGSVTAAAGSASAVAGREAAGRALEEQLRPALTVLNARLLRAVHYEGGDAGADLSSSLERAREAGRALGAFYDRAEAPS